MPLFKVERKEMRTFWVFADDYAAAVRKWKSRIVHEFGDEYADDVPSQISVVCGDSELIL